ncbi:MAG: gamma-glutamylcyclotransferase [Chloroflexi bacterium]|nr:gamma-glutamylcyclotransferase [Chloroflexota bacterium]
MKRERITNRVPSAKPVGIGKLPDKKLAFNKISTKDGTGKTNIITDKGSAVLGVLFEIDESEIVNLDKIEGGYERQNITVLDNDGKPISAFTYVSTKINDALKPHDTYLNYLIQGAEDNGLPQDYIDNLKKIETVPDPEKQR